MKRLRCTAALAALAGLALPACSSPGDGGYHVTAFFPTAVALYDESHVKVMGVDVGRVTDIELEGDRVRVEMLIDESVPLPVGVEAAIIPLSLIGERNIVLSPAWKPGDEKVGDEHVIDEDHTHVPVEPDEALQAVTDLAEAIDPLAVNRLVSGGADALEGRGADLNRALLQIGSLTELLASQDDALLDAAANVHRLAALLNARQEKLGKLIDDFAAASSVLASEREAIAGFLRALVSLTDEGRALITAYEVTLPEDLSTLAEVALTIEANADSVQELVQSLADIGEGVLGAYDPVNNDIRVRITGSPTLVAALQPLWTLLGLGEFPCVPLDTECP